MDNDIRFLTQAASALSEQGAISASKTAARFKRQREIESAIMDFRPDFCESMEGILDALIGSLARNYCPMDYAGKEREALLEVFRAADAFRDALNKADDVVPQ